MASGWSDNHSKNISKTANGKRSKKANKDRQPFLLSRQHLPGSSVRPFFCCGSQVSLNSIPEFKDFTVERNKSLDDDYEDLSDSDDQEPVHVDTTFTLENISKIDTNFKRTVRISGSKHKSVARKKFWTLKLRGKLQVSKRPQNSSDGDVSQSGKSNEQCVCTSYTPNRTGYSTGSSEGACGSTESSTSDTVTFPVSVFAHVVPPPQAYAIASTSKSVDSASGKSIAKTKVPDRSSKLDKPLPFIRINELYPINDIDEQRIAQRQREMEHGIEVEQDDEVCLGNRDDGMPAAGSAIMCSSSAPRVVGPYPTYGPMGLLSMQEETSKTMAEPAISGQKLDTNLNFSAIQLGNSFPDLNQLVVPGVHTQVDYKHYLVPDIDKIINSSFYWGVMDRYQAEKLIENKPEGTFLLRDSAQDEFLFSVSFRRYGRSLHARIEQWNHKFSFDSRDPGVFATDTVCGLIEHYLDPSCCMFFEPMLTRPLHRTFPFSLQHLSRAIICSHITYDGINKLMLPNSLKEYLRFYHYKQKVRVRRFDNVS